jgi:hypothetical protein
MQLDKWVTESCERLSVKRVDFRFTRREVRDVTGWGNTQLKVHLARLVDLEYLALHRVTKGQGFAFELVYDGEGQDGTPFLMGLLEAILSSPGAK